MKRNRRSPTRRKGTKTPTGASINDIALQLKTQDPNLPFEDAKDQAKNLIKARDTLAYGSKGKTSYKVLTHVFGDTMGKQIAKVMSSKEKEEEAASLLADYAQNDKKSDRLSNKELKMIIKKLEKIDTEIKSIKIIKTTAPAPTTVKQTADRSDAHAALASLGYGKGEASKMLEGAPENASTEELIRHALKPAAQRVPVKEVPAAVTQAKSSIEEPPLVIPTLQPKKDSSEQHSNDNKKEAEALRKESEDKERQEKVRRTLFGKLDEIEDEVKKSHSSDWLGKLIQAVLGAFAIGLMVGDFFKKMIDKGIEWISGGLFKSLGDAIYGIMDKLQEKFPLIFGKSDTQKNVDRLKSQGYAMSRDEAVKMGKKTWVDVNDSGISAIHNVNPPKHKPAAQVASEQKAQAITPPTPPTSAAPAKVEAAAAEKREIMAQASAEAAVPPNITVVAPPAQQAPPQQKQKEPFVVIKVRNDEPSAAAYMNNLFNHPVTKSGTSRI